MRDSIEGTPFGHMPEVTAPDAFRHLMRQRLQRQMQYLTGKHTVGGTSDGKMAL